MNKMEPLPTYRMAIEPRSGIWLLFLETLSITFGHYEQQLLQICKSKSLAENVANIEKTIRHLDTETIIRDESQRHIKLRKA